LINSRGSDIEESIMTRLSRRALIRDAGGLFAAAVMTGGSISTGRAQALEKRSVTLGNAGTSSQVQFLAFNVARTRGFIKDEGVDLQVTDFGSGAKAVEALVGGTVDTMIGVYEHVLRMQAKGMDLQTVVTINRTPGLAIAVTKAFAANYKGIRDLKGKYIGISSPGSATHNFLNLILARNGLKPEDVSVIGVGNTLGAIAAIRKGGELQAICNYDPVIAELEREGDVKVVVDTRTEEGTRALFATDYLFNGLVAKADFIKNNPNTVQAMVNGIVRALNWIATASPEQILEAVPKQYWEANRDLYLDTIVKNRSGVSPKGLADIDSAKTVHQAMSQFDAAVRDSKIDLTRTFDNRFTDKAWQTIAKKS
jgi:sulfonate transport system substrate-binding protein